MLTSLGQVLPAAAAKYGNKTALTFEGKSFSFRELDDLSGRLARGMDGFGITPGDRVTLYSANCWEWIVSYYATLKVGAIINPINVMLTPDEVAFVAADCGAKVILTSKKKGEPILGLKDSSDVEEIIIFGNQVPASAQSFNKLIEGNEPGFEVHGVPADALSTICYTSGTTGHPKGAMQSHRSVIMNAALTANMHVRTAEDTIVTALPCPHVYGNVIFNAAFMYGMKLVLHPLFVQDEILQSIQEHSATMFEGVPTMYLYLLEHPRLANYDLSSLTRCTVGGQTMAVNKMQEVEESFGCPLIELWGMTELAGLGTTNLRYGLNKHGSIGVSLPGCEMRIAALDNVHQTLRRGEVGELMARGPIVMQGYYGNAQETAETIEPDGWLHTGDLASMDDDGYITIVDRKKDMILTAGYNVYPAEIERVVAGHPDVAMVAVGRQPDPMKGEIAKAYVVLKKGAPSDEESIALHCRKHLAAYKVPRAVQFVDDLPKTSTGKIMRRELGTLDV